MGEIQQNHQPAEEAFATRNDRRIAAASFDKIITGTGRILYSIDYTRNIDCSAWVAACCITVITGTVLVYYIHIDYSYIIYRLRDKD